MSAAGEGDARACERARIRQPVELARNARCLTAQSASAWKCAAHIKSLTLEIGHLAARNFRRVRSCPSAVNNGQRRRERIF